MNKIKISKTPFNLRGNINIIHKSEISPYLDSIPFNKYSIVEREFMKYVRWH